VSLYLDASAILPIFVAELTSTTVTAFMGAAEEALVVNEYAAAEVASGFSRLTRMGALSDEAAGARLNDFDAWRAALTEDARPPAGGGGAGSGRAGDMPRMTPMA
jgi:predicted nucleic acid-binding protein